MKNSLSQGPRVINSTVFVLKVVVTLLFVVDTNYAERVGRDTESVFPGNEYWRINRDIRGNARATSTVAKGRVRPPVHSIELEDEFPKVYSAVIMGPPRPGSYDKHHMVHFAAEADLIDIIERNIPPLASAGVASNNSTDEFARIEFLVHDQEDMDTLLGLSVSSDTSSPSHAYDIRFEAIETEKVRQLEYRRGLRYEGRALGSYATIPGFSCYKSLSGMESFLRDLSRTKVPNLSVDLLDIGDSYLKTQNSKEGHDLYVIKITGQGVSARNRRTIKGVFFAMFGIHPREFTPPELGARLATHLVDGYGVDADITSMLDHTEIHLLLQANPDGRVLAEQGQSVRKNRNSRNGSCGGGTRMGVDLNRNFPFRWGLNSGSSGNPCSQTYRGPSPMSEPETKAIMNYVSGLFPTGQCKGNSISDRINMACPDDTTGFFMDIHSFGRLNLWSWYFENRKTKNDEALQAVGRKFRHYNTYDLSGPQQDDFLYLVSGSTFDWAHGELGASSHSLELGTRFFQDCNTFENQILPRNLPVLMYAASIARHPYIASKGPDVTKLTLSSTDISINQSSQLIIEAEFSDDEKVGGHHTGEQIISRAQVFIDEHPYDEDPVAQGIDMIGKFNSETETATLVLSFNELLTHLKGTIVGLHRLNVRGEDSDGYFGPVKSMFFNVF